MNVSRAQLKCYAAVLAMWSARFDTWEIAKETGVAESTVASWIAHYRDLMRAAPAVKAV